MRETLIPFYWTDAWLLTAIKQISSKEKYQLWELIATGDAINKALFSFEEFASGIARLLKADLIQEHSGLFKISDSLRKKINEKPQEISEFQFVEEFLCIKSNDFSFSYDPLKIYSNISPEQFSDAINEYLKWSENWQKK